MHGQGRAFPQVSAVDRGWGQMQVLLGHVSLQTRMSNTANALISLLIRTGAFEETKRR